MILGDAMLAKLRAAIEAHIPPAHCNGCDEYLCDHEPGQDAANVDIMLVAVMSALGIRREEKPNPAFKCEKCGEEGYFLGSFSAARFEMQHAQFHKKHEGCLPAFGGGGI